MRQVLSYSILLVLGLVGSQWLPGVVGAAYAGVGDVVRILTMVGLSFIMIRVGYEFDIDKSNLGQYGWDYVVAFTAASLPWLLVSLYFVFVLLPPDAWSTWDAWKETLLAGRFAAPTSAGVLFAMLVASGLGTTWLFRKARILAIFDDLDTVLLMIPLKMLMVGLAWQLGLIIVAMASMLTAAYVFLHRIRIPVGWPWVIAYAGAITGFSEVIYRYSKLIDETVPIHIEVLLPAFVLGCVMAYPAHHEAVAGQTREDHPEIETQGERYATNIVAGAFMILVGLSMPAILTGDTAAESTFHAAGAPAAESLAADTARQRDIGRVTASQPPVGWVMITVHVLAITIISNIGKMFSSFCYRKQAHWRERLAVSIGMWPRGEVGAGVLVISLSYGIGGPVVTVAMLSLALNLLLTGPYIYIVKQLTKSLPGYERG